MPLSIHINTCTVRTFGQRAALREIISSLRITVMHLLKVSCVKLLWEGENGRVAGSIGPHEAWIGWHVKLKRYSMAGISNNHGLYIDTQRFGEVGKKPDTMYVTLTSKDFSPVSEIRIHHCLLGDSAMHPVKDVGLLSMVV